MITLTRLAALNLGIFMVDFVYEYCVTKRHFYAILASMYRSAPFRTLFTVEVILLSFVAYRLITWILFGSLSRYELEFLKENRWPVFVEMAGSFTMFQSSMSMASFVHFMAMYYLALTTILLAKRIELVTIDRGTYFLPT